MQHLSPCFCSERNSAAPLDDTLGTKTVPMSELRKEFHPTRGPEGAHASSPKTQPERHPAAPLSAVSQSLLSRLGS